ncbi:MAG: hypothetical protein EZS28_011768, partial [Streblomastix strix]
KKGSDFCLNNVSYVQEQLLDGFLNGSTSTSLSIKIHIENGTVVDFDKRSLVNFKTGGEGYADADIGTYDPDCGSSEFPCKSITFTRERIGPTTPGGTDYATISKVYARSDSNSFTNETNLISNNEKFEIIGQGPKGQVKITFTSSAVNKNDNLFYLSSTGVVNVQNITIEYEQQLPTFSFFSVNGASLSIDNSQIRVISPVDVISPIIKLSGGTVTISGSDIIGQSQTRIYPGFSVLQTYPVAPLKNSFVVTNSNFANFSSSTRNGTIFNAQIRSDGIDTFKISGGSIRNTKVSTTNDREYGGAIYVKVYSGAESTYKNNLLISDVAFNGNDAFDNEHGPDVYFEISNIRQNFDTNVVKLFDDSLEYKSYGRFLDLDGSIDNTPIPLNNLRGGKYFDTIYVSSVTDPVSLRGYDRDWCGQDTPFHCATMQYAYGRFNSGPSLTLRIINRANIDSNGLIAQSKQADLTINSARDTPANLYVSKESDTLSVSLISVIKSLTLQNLEIDFQGVDHTRIFVHLAAKYSKLTLDNVYVHNGQFNEHAFLVDDGVSIDVTNSRFDGLVSHGTGGSAIRVDLSGTATATFTDSQFTNNVVEKGYQGGALLISISGDYSAVEAVQFIKNVTFTNNIAKGQQDFTVYDEDLQCSATSGDSYQQSLFIDLQGGNFAKAMKSEDKLIDLGGINRFELELSHTSCFVHTYAGSDSVDPNIDLTLFVKDIKSNNTYANSKDLERATNETWCGREFFPCDTLDQAVRHVSNPGICVYVYEEALVFKSILLSAHSLRFEGKVTDTTSKPRIFFNENDFIDPEDPDNNKGFLIISDATLNITNLAFEISGKTRILIGLIYKDNIGDVQIKSCDFYVADQSLKVGYLTEGAAIQVNNSVAIISYCNFLNIKGGSDGAVYLNISNINGNTSITESHFENCETQGVAGGAITVDYNRNTGSDRGGFELKRTEIFNCRGISGTNQQNAAIYFTGIVPGDGNNPLFIDECYFKENGISSTQDDGAHDLFFVPPVGSNILNNITGIRYSYSNSLTRKIGGISGGSPNYDYLLPGIEEDYYVDVPENEDAPNGTGTEIDPYKNVNLAVSHLPDHGIVKVKIHIVTKRPFTHKSVDIGSKTAIIIGRRVENPNVQIYMDYPGETQAMFKLDQEGYLELINLTLAGVKTVNSIIQSSGTLVITDCEIKGSGQYIFDTSAIITTSGTAKINNCEFNSFEVSQSLFSIGQSRITITNSNFNHIVGDINGLIISEDNLNSNAIITLKNLSFTNLQSTTPNGRGSVIFLNIQSFDPPFQFDGLQFSNCTIDNRDSYIYIKTDNLKTRFPNADKLPFANNTNTGWEFSGEDLEITRGIEIPLHYLWNPYKSDKVYVGEIVGVDELWCGRSDWPCKTLDIGYKRFNNSELNTFVIVGSVQLNEQIDIARSLEFESSDINIRASIRVNINAQFNALVGGGKFAIHNINLFFDSTLSKSLIVASGQQRDVTIENVIFERGQLSPTESIQILDKLIRVDTIQSLTIQDVTFEDFELTFETPSITQRGLCIYAVNVPNITISRSIFRNLKSANLGLALAAVYNQQFTQTANINIYYTQFYNLIQQNSNGGGAIYYEGNNLNIPILNVCYFEGDISTNANDIYFNDITIPNQISSTRFVESFSNSGFPKIGPYSAITSNATIQGYLGSILHTVIVNGSNPSASDSNINGTFKTINGSVYKTPLIYEMIPRTIQIVEYTSVGAYNENGILNINNKLLTFERHPGSITVRINTAVGQQFDKLVSVTNGQGTFKGLFFSISQTQSLSSPKTIFSLEGSGKIEIDNCSILHVSYGYEQVNVNLVNTAENCGGNILIKDSTIENFNLASNKLIVLNRGVNTQIINNNFRNINVTASGSSQDKSVIFADIDTTSDFYLENNRLNDNDINDGGDYFSVVYLNIDTNPDSKYHYHFKNNTFQRNAWLDQNKRKLPLYDHRTFIFIQSDELQTVANEESLKGQELQDPAPELYQGKKLQNIVNAVDLYDLTTTYNGADMHVGPYEDVSSVSHGNDEMWCGKVGMSCRTLNHVISTKSTTITYNYHIHFTTTQNYQLRVDRNPTTITGYGVGSDKATIRINTPSGTNSLIYVNTASLTIKKIIIHFISQISNEHIIYFNSGSGTLNLTDFEFSGEGGVDSLQRLIGGDVINVQNGNVLLDRCSFINILSQPQIDSQKGIIRIQKQSGKTLSISNTEFRNVYIAGNDNLGSTYIIQIRSSDGRNINFGQSVTFDSSRNIFIDAHSLRDVMNISRNVYDTELINKFKEDYADDDGKVIPKDHYEYEGYDQFGHTIALGRFFTELKLADDETIHVNINGVDSPYCGDYIIPCQTLKYAADTKAINQTNNSTILVNAAVNIKNQVQLNSKINSIIGPSNDNRGVISVYRVHDTGYQQGAIFINQDGYDSRDLNLRNLDIIVVNSSNYQHLIQTSQNEKGYEVIIENVNIMGNVGVGGSIPQMSNSLIHAYNPTLFTLNNVLIKDFIITEGGVSIQDRYTGWQQAQNKGGAILVATSLADETIVKLENVVIDGINGQDVSGVGIAIVLLQSSSKQNKIMNVDQQFIFNKSTFKENTAVYGLGGAIALYNVARGQFYITDCEFDRNLGSIIRREANDIYIEPFGTPGDEWIVLKDTVIKDCQSTSLPSKLLIKGISLSPSEIDDILPTPKYSLFIDSSSIIQDPDGSQSRPYTSIGESLIGKETVMIGYIIDVQVNPGIYIEREIIIGDLNVEITGLDEQDFVPVSQTDKSVAIHTEEGEMHQDSVITVSYGSLTLQNLQIRALPEPSREIIITLDGIGGQTTIINTVFVEYSSSTIYELPFIKAISGMKLKIQQSYFSVGQYITSSESSMIEIKEDLNEFIIEDSTFENYPYDGSNIVKNPILDAKLRSWSDVHIRNTLFKGPLNVDDPQMHNKNNNNDDNQICNWDSSLIHVTGGTIYIEGSTLSGWESGAISVEGSEAGVIIIGESIFQNNNPQFSDYPNVRRNILCSGGAFVNSDPNHFIGDDDQQSPSKWIYSNDNDCILKGGLQDLISTSFIPTLTRISSQEDFYKQELKIRFEGENLIPCGLIFELFNHDNPNEIYQGSVPYTEGVSNENVFEVIISLSLLPQDAFIDGRILYGNGGSTDSFSVYQSGACAEGQDPDGCKCYSSLIHKSEEECPCPTDADELLKDPRKDLVCKQEWNEKNEVFVGDKNLILEEETQNWEVRSSSDSIYGKTKQTPLDSLENGLLHGVIKSNEMNIIVVTALDNVSIEIPTERLTSENCDTVRISRDYSESQTYPIRITSGRLFSIPGAVKPMFKVERSTLILSSVDVVSIGSQSGSMIQGQSLIVGTQGSKITISDVLMTMLEQFEGIFHSLSTSSIDPSYTLKSFIEIQNSILTMNNFTAIRGRFTGKGAIGIEQESGLINISDGIFKNLKIVSSQTS